MMERGCTQIKGQERPLIVDSVYFCICFSVLFLSINTDILVRMRDIVLLCAIVATLPSAGLLAAACASVSFSICMRGA